MRYTLYADPRTHAFALVALRSRFTDGDALPVNDVDRWFGRPVELLAWLALATRRSPRSRTS